MTSDIKINTPKGMRLHIGLFGRRNAGKSSLLNAITRQDVSIVSPSAGTTTDPVEKPMELLPLGPVLFIDTAGIDDEGALGSLRVQKSRRVLERTDLGVVVATADAWGSFEEQLVQELAARGLPVIVVLNKVDLNPPDDELLAKLAALDLPVVETVASERKGVLAFREALLAAAPAHFLDNPVIVRDLVPKGELALLVIPIDKEAPKGRIILPQVQTLRDLLDGDAMALVVKERELGLALASLKKPPKLVVTDSQAFAEVAAITPAEVPLTGFSILFSRFKGDLVAEVEGALAVARLRPKSRVLIAEACSHHPIEEDIGRVKIPAWLTRHVGGELDFTHVQGHDFPEDLGAYELVIHCGACMFNRRAMLQRIAACQRARVPITNYGLVIAYTLGILERALGPFAEAAARYRELCTAC